MKRSIGILFCVLTLPGVGWAQSRLVFPRVFPVAELKTTGFAVVNPGTTNASVLFSLLKPDVPLVVGNTVGETIASTSLTVPAKGQLSKLGAELFGNVSAAGWVQVTSTTTGLQGFWIGGDFATYTDGADAASAAVELAFPLVAGQTEINIANLSPFLGGARVLDGVTLRLLGLNGTELGPPVTKPVGTLGAYQAKVSELFPSADLSQAAYIRATGSSGSRIAGTEIVRGFLVKTESAVLNAVDATTATNTLNFAQAASGSVGAANYTTMIGVINLSSTAQTATITFHPEPNGTPIVVQRPLPASGALRETAANLFNLSSAFQTGWIQVSSTGPITGFVAYADSVSGALAAVPVQTSPQRTMLFDQIAGAPTWYTGIGLLNASTTDANVEVFALTPGGTLIGGAANVPTASFTVPAGHKVAKLLGELIPAAASQNGGFLYVRTTNDVPLYGIELFGSDTLPILSNVAASGLAGVTYVPPRPSEPLNLASISPVRAIRGSTLTLSGNGFGYPEINNTIVFTTATGTVEATAATASLTTLTAVVPMTAITGPVSVRTGGQNSTPIVLEVTAGETTMVQTPVVISEGQVTDNADIYVPPSSGTLRIVAIGAGDVNAASYYVGPFPVILPRGQTQALIIIGPGINPAFRSTVTIPGPGVTVTGDTLVENGYLLNVKVDANAAVGPRSIFVTNSNLNTLSIPGGVNIR